MYNSVLNKLKFIVSQIDDIICGQSPQDIVLATLNGECRGEPADGQVAVRNVIKNRADGPKYFKNSNPLYTGNDNEAKACLSPFQFSIWNGKTTCLLFLAAYNRIMADATIESIPAVDYSVFTTGTGLTEAQAKKIYLYCNPKTATSKEEWVVLTKKESAANPNKKSWSIKTTFKGREVQITFIRIGNHVFLHGIQ